MLKAEPGVFCGILLGTVSILFSGAFYLKSPTQWILGYFIGFWAYLVLFFKAQRSRFFFAGVGRHIIQPYRYHWPFKLKMGTPVTGVIPVMGNVPPNFGSSMPF